MGSRSEREYRSIEGRPGSRWLRRVRGQMPSGPRALHRRSAGGSQLSRLRPNWPGLPGRRAAERSAPSPERMAGAGTCEQYGPARHAGFSVIGPNGAGKGQGARGSGGAGERPRNSLGTRIPLPVVRIPAPRYSAARRRACGGAHRTGAPQNGGARTGGRR